MIIKKLFAIPIIAVTLLSSFYATADGVGAAMSKVTIVVHGMMKSKSGAT